MLGDFITRFLVIILGFAYPAFECFKTVEKNKADIEQLRFWCQYWIIVAMVTVFERMGEILVSWLPLYGELKLAFFIYLWYPKTKGTSYVFENLLRPYIAKHETEIDRKLTEVRARAWDIALLYWQNAASQGQLKFYELLQFLAKQSTRNGSSQNEDRQQKEEQHETPKQHQQQPPAVVTRQWQQAPPPPPPSPAVDRALQYQRTKSEVVSQRLSEATTAVSEQAVNGDDAAQESHVDGTLLAARVRLRRAQTGLSKHN